MQSSSDKTGYITKLKQRFSSSTFIRGFLYIFSFPVTIDIHFKRQDLEVKGKFDKGQGKKLLLISHSWAGKENDENPYFVR